MFDGHTVRSQATRNNAAVASLTPKLAIREPPVVPLLDPHSAGYKQRLLVDGENSQSSRRQEADRAKLIKT
jgi:hypothetical protein